MDYLGKGEMLTDRDVKNMCTEFERNKVFVHMDILGIFYFSS
jgi:hypothetical protein